MIYNRYGWKNRGAYSAVGENKRKIRFYRHSNVRVPTLSSTRKRRYVPSMLIGRADLMPSGVNNLEIVANSALVTSGRFIDREGTAIASDRKISHSAQSPLADRTESRAVNFVHAFPDRKIDAISRIATGCVHYHLLAPLPAVQSPRRQPSRRFRERVALGKMLPPAITGNVLPLLVGWAHLDRLFGKAAE